MPGLWQNVRNSLIYLNKMRNIANVVHDLKPIVNFLNLKINDLAETRDPDLIVDLLEKISHDAKMLDRYLQALDKEAKEYNIAKG